MQPQRDAPKLVPFDLEIAAHYRRTRLTCPACGGWGEPDGEITGRQGIPDEVDVSCINCGERWWIPKEQG